MGQASILEFLKKKGGEATVNELEVGLQQSNAGVGYIIRRLEKQGLITREWYAGKGGCRAKGHSALVRLVCPKDEK